MEANGHRTILIATFKTSSGAARGAAALGANLPGQIDNVSLLTVDGAGRPSSADAELWDGQVSRVSRVISRLAHQTMSLTKSGAPSPGHPRDSSSHGGNSVRTAGPSLGTNASALVLEIESSVLSSARGLLEPVGAVRVVAVDGGAVCRSLTATGTRSW